jgi:hypothetical protein
MTKNECVLRACCRARRTLRGKYYKETKTFGIDRHLDFASVIELLSGALLLMAFSRVRHSSGIHNAGGDRGRRFHATCTAGFFPNPEPRFCCALCPLSASGRGAPSQTRGRRKSIATPRRKDGTAGTMRSTLSTQQPGCRKLI